MKGRLTVFEWIFAGAVGLIAAWLVLSATSVYGAGISSDSVFYISSADNFAKGAGFVDFKGDPLIDFPPLYSFILGILRWATEYSAFVLGRFLNALVIALLVLSTGVLIRRCLPERRVWFYLGVLATVLLLPLYTLAANIASDPLYILMTVWYCLAAQSLLSSRSNPWLVLTTLLAAASTLLRWIGLALVVSQFILVFIAFRQNLKKAILFAFFSSSLAFLPIFLWEFGRNIILYGAMGSRVNPVSVDAYQNLKMSISRILAWFSPNPLISFMPLVILFVIAVFVVNRRNDWKRWLQRLFHNPVLPIVLVSGVYFIAVTLTGYTSDHLQAFDDRYQAPLYFFIIIFLFLSLDELIFFHTRGLANVIVTLIVVGVFCLWGANRISLLSNFVQASKDQGVVAYNDYNTKKMIRSGLVVYLIKNPPSLDVPIYTNEPEAIYFFLRRPARMSPYDPNHYVYDPNALKVLYPRWPEEEVTTLIWFKPSNKRNYYRPEEIEQLANLEKIYKRWDGEVYIARPKE